MELERFRFAILRGSAEPSSLRNLSAGPYFIPEGLRLEDFARFGYLLEFKGVPRCVDASASPLYIPGTKGGSKVITWRSAQTLIWTEMPSEAVWSLDVQMQFRIVVVHSFDSNRRPLTYTMYWRMMASAQSEYTIG